MNIFLIFISCLLFFYGLNSQTLTQFIEYYYVESAREIIELNEWLVPHFNYEYRFDKPILFYWLVAFSYKIFGVSWASARLVSSLCAAGVAFFTWRYAKEKLGNEGAITATAVLLSTPHFMLQSRDAMTDMTLTFFITLSIYSYVRMVEKSRHSRFWFWGLYIGLALATLTKGPLGFVLPMVVILGHLCVKKDLRLFFSVKPFWGCLVYLLIISPWTYLVIDRYGLDAMLNIIHMGDAAGKDPIQEPFYYYFQHLFMEFFPWGPVLIFIMVCGFFFDRKHLVKKMKQDVFPYLWVLLPILLLSLFSKKIARYILPVAPAIAILLAGFITELLTNKRKYISGVYRGFIYTLSFVFLILGVVTGVAIKLIYQNLHDPTPLFFLLPVLLLSGGAYLMRTVYSRRYINISVVTAGIIITSFLFTTVHVMAALDSRPLIDFGNRIHTEAQAGDKAAIYRKDCNKIVFYARRKVEEIGTPDQLKKVTEGEGSAFCVIREQDFKEIDKSISSLFTIIGKKYRWKKIDTIERIWRYIDNPDEFKDYYYLIKS